MDRKFTRILWVLLLAHWADDTNVLGWNKMCVNVLQILSLRGFNREKTRTDWAGLLRLTRRIFKTETQQ